VWAWWLLLLLLLLLVHLRHQQAQEQRQRAQPPELRVPAVLLVLVLQLPQQTSPHPVGLPLLLARAGSLPLPRHHCLLHLLLVGLRCARRHPRCQPQQPGLQQTGRVCPASCLVLPLCLTGLG
jgi:hypothetical protein